MKNKLNFFNPREVRMSYNFTRGIPVIVASLMVTSGIYAADKMAEMPNGCSGVALCTNQPDIDCNGFEIDVGLLYEQFRVSGSDVGFTIASGVALNSVSNVSTMQYPTWDMKCGVTVGLGYMVPHDDWSVNARFDWLQGNGGVSTSNPGAPVDGWVRGSYFSAVQNGMSDTFGITYYNLDVFMEKGVFLTPCFELEPGVGIKSAWINYKNAATYGPTYTLMNSTDFWGVGPEFGVHTRWHLANGFSLDYMFSTAFLFGYNSMLSRYATDTGTTAVVSGNNQVFSPAIRSILGVCFEKRVYCDRQYVFLRAGWDTSIYFNQYNHLVVGDGSVYSTYNTSYNNLFGMTGLIVDFGWVF